MNWSAVGLPPSSAMVATGKSGCGSGTVWVFWAMAESSLTTWAVEKVRLVGGGYEDMHFFSLLSVSTNTKTQNHTMKGTWVLCSLENWDNRLLTVPTHLCPTLITKEVGVEGHRCVGTVSNLLSQFSRLSTQAPFIVCLCACTVQVWCVGSGCPLFP